MRLIDADAYAAEMKKRQDACMEAMENASYDGEQFSPKEHWEGVLAAFAEAKLTLDDMQTVNGWISVKDRLPDNEQDVLAYLDCGEETRIAPCNYVNGVWFDCTMNCVVILQHVTHWMPLPEPPKEESK